MLLKFAQHPSLTTIYSTIAANRIGELAFPAFPVGSVMQILHCEAISHIDILSGFAPHRIAVHERDRVA
jgi:hypothetical protein